jgi:Endonuclease I/Secretion system C-terminal sorting domain
MTKFIYIFLFLLVSVSIQAQTLYINELDSDTPGLDTKEFVEIKSSIANFSLDGFVIVFFNGSTNANNSSYWVVDLSGQKTDINGLFVVGNEALSPSPNMAIPDNTIQNGADGVAVYKRSALDFPEGTTAFVDNTLIDILVYGTADPDATTMLDIFKAFNPNIKQINEGSSNNTNSIQRDNNGGYFSAVPTPRKNNDGSGIELNGIRTIFPKTIFAEGESFDITFQLEFASIDDVVLAYTLENGSFNGSDYAATTRLTIPKGQNSTTTTVKIIDDNLDEGDEEMIFRLTELPVTFVTSNNNLKIRVEDNDFKISPFGTPLSPTYGKVSSTATPGYYSKTDKLSGINLISGLRDIISDPTIVRAHTYNDVIDILKEADQNPANNNQVWLVYLEKGRSKIDLQLTSDNAGSWNREHVWPRSRGGFNSIEADEAFDGIDIFWPTNTDSTRHGNSDAHSIRAVDGQENTKRGNQFYGQYNGPLGNLGSFKGDVARSIFYLAVRFKALDVVNGFPEGEVGKFGDLATLLEWHRNDPPDDFEMNRNNVVQKWQYNRNPFIDMPEIVEYIWGNKQGQVWNLPSSTHDFQTVNVKIIPNPVYDHIIVETDFDIEVISIYGQDGKLVYSVNQESNIVDISKLTSGNYILEVSNGQQKKKAYFIKM